MTPYRRECLTKIVAGLLRAGAATGSVTKQDVLDNIADVPHSQKGDLNWVHSWLCQARGNKGEGVAQDVHTSKELSLTFTVRNPGDDSSLWIVDVED